MLYRRGSIWATPTASTGNVTTSEMSGENGDGADHALRLPLARTCVRNCRWGLVHCRAWMDEREGVRGCGRGSVRDSGRERGALPGPGRPAGRWAAGGGAGGVAADVRCLAGGARPAPALGVTALRRVRAADRGVHGLAGGRRLLPAPDQRLMPREASHGAGLSFLPVASQISKCRCGPVE